MPSITEVNHDKAVLKLIFMAVGINNIEVEARRLEVKEPCNAQALWDEAVKKRRHHERLDVENFFKDERMDRPPNNYLYLVPNRTLLQAEWKKFEPVISSLYLEGDIQFSCSMHILTENGVFKTAPDVREYPLEFSSPRRVFL